ncbi:hypothetical protein ADK76_03650 [Streptomyces griseoflavus]|nr:hypothetical protein ADK76_03650 [Streptomyces griseoflavus]
MAGGQFFQARSEAAVPQEFVHAAAVGAWGQGRAGAGHVVGEAGEQAVEGRTRWAGGSSARSCAAGSSCTRWAAGLVAD